MGYKRSGEGFRQQMHATNGKDRSVCSYVWGRDI